MVAAASLVDLARRYVLGPDEPITWMREFPDGPAVDIEAAERSYSLRVARDWLVEREPWVDAVVVVRRDDLDVEGPAPREVLLVPHGEAPVRLGDPDAVAELGSRVFDGSLDPVAFAEILVACQWPWDGPTLLVTEPETWRTGLPTGVDVPEVGRPHLWTEAGARWLTFYASREDPHAYGDAARVTVHQWTVGFPPAGPATWRHQPVAQSVVQNEERR